MQYILQEDEYNKLVNGKQNIEDAVKEALQPFHTLLTNLKVNHPNRDYLEYTSLVQDMLPVNVVISVLEDALNKATLQRY